MREPMDESRLIELAALPPDHPRRAEAAKDARVRAWLLEHDAFLEAAPLTPEEEGSVSRAAAAAIARARAESPRPAGTVLEMPRPAKATRGVPRWALAAAGVAIVAGAAIVVPRFLPEPSNELRSLSAGQMAGAFASEPARRDAQGRIVLAWRPAPRATAYRVEILSGLDAVATHDVTGADRLVLDPASLPAGDSLLWRVIALRDGETLATTAPRELPR